MMDWWRRWVWVPRRDRWPLPRIPFPLWKMDDIIREAYLPGLHAALSQPSALLSMFGPPVCPWCDNHPEPFCVWRTGALEVDPRSLTPRATADEWEDW